MRSGWGGVAERKCGLGLGKEGERAVLDTCYVLGS